jgi:hypothetical protein
MGSQHQWPRVATSIRLRTVFAPTVVVVVRAAGADAVAVAALPIVDRRNASLPLTTSSRIAQACSASRWYSGLVSLGCLHYFPLNGLLRRWKSFQWGWCCPNSRQSSPLGWLLLPLLLPILLLLAQL